MHSFLNTLKQSFENLPGNRSISAITQLVVGGNHQFNTTLTVSVKEDNK